MNTLDFNYNKLLEKVKDITIIQSTADVIRWDMETKMPPKGIALRSEQLAMLGKIEHKMITDPEIGTLLDKIEEHPDHEMLDRIHRRNVYLIRKNYNEQVKIPEELVVETERQRAVTIDTWKRAKTAMDFSMFKPELEKLTNLRKKAAEILMEVKHTSTPYNALIDIYEPKMTSELLIKIFKKLKVGLTSILGKCQESLKKPDVSILQRGVPIDTQRRISYAIARFIEYDVESKRAGGRIDETEHPFTSGYYDDVRVTTHYYENNFISSITSVLHEGGHAIYEQNLNSKWMYQPIGSSCSLGIHESQSRFFENIIGRSYEFWSYFLPKLKRLTGDIFEDVDLNNFVLAVNQVRPSKIRVAADEITYCLHIIIRFEIERDLMSGEIAVADLPEIWNQKYEDYLGVKIENDSEGVMQDTHWASGLQGYFPTYALGNIYSGQILARIRKDVPNWKEEIVAGNFSNVKGWLIENIHRYGNLYDPADLIKKITGEEIGIKHYLDYLNEKYSQLYGY